MAMRMSGLMSGMDTESLISQLVEARSTKVNKAKKAQTKLEWKQDAWKDLNTKLKNLQSKFISNMRFSSAYSKKVTKVSNPNAVSVITGENAVNGVQTLEINKLAKTGYLTGGELKGENNAKGEYTALTKLSELGFEGKGTINVTAGKNNAEINVDESTTISDVLTQLKSAGLNASFDTKSQRIFVSSKESGEAADFSIIAGDQKGAEALGALGLYTAVAQESDKATWQKYQAYAVKGEDGKYTAKTLSQMSNEITKTLNDKTDSYLKQYKSLQESLDAATIKNEDIQAKLTGEDGLDRKITALQDEIDRMSDEDEAKALKQQELEVLTKEKENLEVQKVDISAINDKIAKVEEYITVSEDADGNLVADATPKLTKEINDSFAAQAEYAAKALNGTTGIPATATKVSGQDAEITLNGAKFTSNTNSFEINGLTFTALSETKEGESITVTTEQDTAGIYDMIKNFLKEYNSIINEMDKLYNAESAKGYEPLLDDEKQAMSDSEVEKYEKKIKDALLRRDSNLSDISSAMRSVMADSIEIGGKKMHLYDFGIDMLGYFSAPDNEKNAYHIDGDPDDADTSGKADKLKSLIASDPDTVISFFTKLSQKLYDKMTDMSKSMDGYRSFGSFYDDKKMKSDYKDYTSKIKDMEDKLNKYEDSWYKKFSKMETAMAKMQRNANAISGLLGGGGS